MNGSYEKAALNAHRQYAIPTERFFNRLGNPWDRSEVAGRRPALKHARGRGGTIRAGRSPKQAQGSLESRVPFG
jgi:hypothetical protein